jgi:hypothetical protein
VIGDQGTRCSGILELKGDKEIKEVKVWYWSTRRWCLEIKENQVGNRRSRNSRCGEIQEQKNQESKSKCNKIRSKNQGSKSKL